MTNAAGGTAREGLRRAGTWGALLCAGVVQACVQACAPAAPSTKPPTTEPSNLPDDGPPPPPPSETFVSSEEPGRIGSCAVFPSDMAFHADIRRLPVHADSGRWLEAYGLEASVLLPTVPDRSNPLSTARFGDPINRATSTTPRVQVEYNGVLPIERQYGGPFPKPAGFVIEDGFDQHTIVVDTDECAAYELIGATDFFGVLRALGGARWDLGSPDFNVDLQAVTAPRLPLVAGLVRIDEVVAGHIDHALAFVVPNTSPDVVWPAARSDGRNEDGTGLPMGAWIRLRDDVDTSGFPPSVRVVAEALQVHGAILADTGGVRDGFVLSIERGEFVDVDGRVIDDELARIREFVHLSDLDVVDATPMPIAADSLAIR